MLSSGCLLLQGSPEIKAFMAQQGLASVAELETYFEGRVLGLARQAGRNYIVWQVNMLPPTHAELACRGIPAQLQDL